MQKNNLLTILIIGVLLLVSAKSHAQFSGGEGTEADPYEIANTYDLIYLSQVTPMWDKHFIQTSDITFDADETQVDWDGDGSADGSGTAGFSPIGQYTNSEFTGSYNGQNYSIQNLYINRPDEINVGLFGFVTSSASISSVEIIGGNITGEDDVGALIGDIDNSTVTGCSATADVTCSGNDNGETAGGLIGISEESNISNSFATGTVSGPKYSGGLIGTSLSGTIDNCYAEGTVETTANGYAGGLIGNNDDASISNSYATGNVSGDFNIGGLLGDNEGPVTNCYASGQITATDDEVGGLIGDHDVSDVTNCYATGNIDADDDVGSLIGYVHGGATISRCYTTGSVDGNQNVGGIAGKMEESSSILDSYAINTHLNGSYDVGGIVGDMDGGIVENSYAVNKVSASNTGENGIAGYISGGATINSSFFDKTINPGMPDENEYGKTTVEMKDYNTFTDAGWDFVSETTNGTDDYWDMDQLGTVNNGYPILSWQEGADDILFDPPYSDGEGTTDNPYEIATTADLIELSNTSEDWDKHFKQTADITFDADETQVDWNGDGSAGPAEGFSPIGNTSTKFTGTYDGQDYTIDSLFINRPSTDYIGLFGYTDGADFTNIGVTNVDLTGDTDVGGLVGKADNNSTISTSYSTGTISGSGNYVGGLVGWNSHSTVSNSYSTGSVSGGTAVGGLVGYNNSSTIENSYSTGSVNGSTYDGGLVGYNTGTVNNSFWDTETSNQATSDGGTAKTTAQMQTESTFTGAGWDLTNTWEMSSPVAENGYPHLQWENITTPVATSPSQVSGKYQIATLDDLRWIAEDADRWSNDYEQTADIDANVTSNWDDGKGWTPIGNGTTQFTGSYNGQDHTIDNLYINRPSTSNIGLFGSIEESEIRNLELTNIDVTGFEYNVGGLVGQNDNGTVEECTTSTGSVNGTDGTSSVGGLVGSNYGTVNNSNSSVGVSGDENIGGLVGNNYYGTVSNSTSSGNVSGDENIGGLVGNNTVGTVSNSNSSGEVDGININIGGLVGNNISGTVSNSNSSGNVSGGVNGDNIGGLVGYNNNEVSNSTSSGDVSGDENIGGLVGYNYSGTVDECTTSTGTVTGDVYVGGLVGHNDNSATVSNSISNGSVNAASSSYVGGLVGKNDNSTITNSTNTGSLVGYDYAGGLVGYNYQGTVSSSANTGNVEGEDDVGGLVGNNYQGTISNSSSSGSVTGNNEVGGLVGENFSSSEITNSFNTGDVTGDDYIGGLVGKNQSNCSISNSYNSGIVTGNNNYIGGLAGGNYGTVDNSYSTGSVSGNTSVGGLIGTNGGTVNNSFWDTETSGQNNSDGGTGKTTDEMTAYATFYDAGWSFCPPETHSGGNWTIDESTTSPDNEGYPALFWQGLTNYIESTPGLWTGSTSSDWNTTSNWDDGNVPTSTVDVTIPSSCSNYPSIDESAICQNITIENEGEININSSYTLEINGDFTLNDGGIFSNNGSLRFSGTDCHLSDNRTNKLTLGNIQVGDNVRNNQKVKKNRSLK